MAQTETKNVTTKPVIITAHSVVLITAPFAKNFTSFKPLAPNITGTAIKNENSVPTNREQPTIIAPKIVEPEREVPGTKDST